MQTEIMVLLSTAIAIAFLHTLTGPDHYVPFIALSASRGWSYGRLAFWTLLCGTGHVLSSVVLGLAGAALGWSLSSIGWLQEVRGGLAGNILLLFGISYTAWGVVRDRSNRKHKHFDVVENKVFVYEHQHGQAVLPKERHTVTPWVMFIIFLLGPCEPMIPLLSFPAARHSVLTTLILIGVYTAFTLATMLVMVTLGYYGYSLFKTNVVEKYLHTIAGATIMVCGAGIVFLNW